MINFKIKLQSLFSTDEILSFFEIILKIYLQTFSNRNIRMLKIFDTVRVRSILK